MGLVYTRISSGHNRSEERRGEETDGGGASDRVLKLNIYVYDIFDSRRA